MYPSQCRKRVKTETIIDTPRVVDSAVRNETFDSGEEIGVDEVFGVVPVKET